MVLLRKIIKIPTSWLVIEIFFLLCIYTFIFYTFCDESDFSGFDEDKKMSSSERLLNMFYFTSVTCSTIGYGDIYPKTFKSRLLCSTLILLIIYFSFH